MFNYIIHKQQKLQYRRGAFTCVGWQVTLCDPIWQVTSRSCEMGVPLTAIHCFFIEVNSATVYYSESTPHIITDSQTSSMYYDTRVTIKKAMHRCQLVENIEGGLSIFSEKAWWSWVCRCRGGGVWEGAFHINSPLKVLGQLFKLSSGVLRKAPTADSF